MTNTIYGSEKGDRIALYDGPTEGNDDIFGYGGDDVIWALGGHDWIRGGSIPAQSPMCTGIFRRLTMFALS